jgi:hypothetical protein
MVSWISVPEDGIKKWVKGIGDNSHVQCFQLARTHGSMDGPWSYVLFVLDPAKTDIITAYFVVVHTEALEMNSNPLEGTSGISLTQDELRGLIALLEKQVYSMTEDDIISDSGFQPIRIEEYVDYHLDQTNSKYVEEYYYRQIETQYDVNGNSILTIVLFSRDLPYHDDSPYSATMELLKGLVHHYQGVYFQVMQFPNSELQNPGFRPQDHGIPRAFLRSGDIRAIVALCRMFVTE